MDFVPGSPFCRKGCLALAIVSACIFMTGCQLHQRTNYQDKERDTSPKQVRVAGVVLKWVIQDKETNYERAVPLIRQAALRGADIVMTTECFLDGYAIRDKTIPIEQWRALGEQIPGGDYVRKLRALADELDIYLVAGMLERDGRATYNTAILINDEGELVGKYRKQRLGHELLRNTVGDESKVFSTPFGDIGIMICADRRYPEIAREMAANGADLILVPSGGMWGPEKNDFYLQDRSRENSVPIVFVHPIEFLVTGPDGKILARDFAGKDMSLSHDKLDSPADLKRVHTYDLTIVDKD